MTSVIMQPYPRLQGGGNMWWVDIHQASNRSLDRGKLSCKGLKITSCGGIFCKRIQGRPVPPWSTLKVVVLPREQTSWRWGSRLWGCARGQAGCLEGEAGGYLREAYMSCQEIRHFSLLLIPTPTTAWPSPTIRFNISNSPHILTSMWQSPTKQSIKLWALWKGTEHWLSS